ncbi:MAG TPA: hypothetical protein VND88_08235 [Candidatus Acidoferrales bacterium]|nr:hypothetical protein [Candidatus Acidoferrales bacterium]
MLAITRPLSGRPAAAMAYKLARREAPAQHPSPTKEVPMTDLHAWKPVSLAEDDDEGDDEEEGEDDDDE